MGAVSQSSHANRGVFLGAFSAANSSQTSSRAVGTPRQQNWAVPPVPLVSGKRLITPLGCLVNGNSTSSSLFRFGGEMGDAVRYLRCNSAYWEDFPNPPFFNQEIKRSFWYPSFQTSFGQHPNPKPTPVFCQNHVITQLCSNFLLLLGALLFPLHLSFFFSYSNKQAHRIPVTALSPGTAVQSS